MNRTSQLLQTALEATSNGVLITDNTRDDNPIIYINPGFERMTGYTLEEILGRNCRFLQGPDTNRDDVTRLRESIKKGETLMVELLNYKKDGTPFWNELTVSPVKDSGGAVTHFVGIQADITDRREREKARRAQLMAENIVDTVREPLVILSDNLTVLSVNQSFYRFFQTHPEETIGRHLYEIENGYLNIPPLKMLIERILPEKNPFEDFEITHDFPRIGVKTLLLNARRIDRDEERPEYILLAMEDITRWKQDKTALFESERRSRLLVEGIKDIAMITADGGGRITSWNPGAQQVIGYSEGEIVGRPVDTLFTREDVERGIPQDELHHALEAGSIVEERWLVRKDGSRYWAICVLSAIYDESGAFQGYAKLIHEQTERKLLQEEVIRRTEDLAARDRAKDEFLAMLGHELRNPLSAATSAVQVVKMLGNKEVERPLAILDRQIGNMGRLVNDLLDVARVTQGKIALQLKRLSLDELVLGVLRSLQENAKNKGLALKTNIEPDIFVQGDALRLEQVINNLVNNSIKYTPAGEVRVSLEKRDGRAILTVSDTGIGIDNKLVPHLFELFSQASRGLARSDGGLGVGLTIVKSLVELHEGTVEGQSEGEGKGSTFRVSLPLDEAQNEDVEEDQSEAPETDSRHTILVVDDSIDAAEMIALTLELWGYRILTAHDGEEALQVALSQRPQVVLLDIGLPGLDGYQVAQQLREKVPSETMKLIALTGYTQDSDVQKALDVGFDTHLAKPIDFSSLKDLLRSYTNPM